MGEPYLIEAPNEEPVSLAQAKAHLRVDGADDDATITQCIAAAAEYVRNRSGFALVEAQYGITFDRFPSGSDPLPLPLPPLVSIDSITYLDSDGDSTELDEADYRVLPRRRPGCVVPVRGTVWPATSVELDAVTVEFTCGFGEADDVPRDLHQCLLLLIGHFFENREALTTGSISKELELTVSSLLAPYEFELEWQGET